MANAKRIRRTLKGSNKILFMQGLVTGSDDFTPLPELSKAEAQEVSQARAAELKADTEAALKRPSQPTEQQKQRLNTSATARENLRPKRAARLEHLRQKFSGDTAPGSADTHPKQDPLAP